MGNAIADSAVILWFLFVAAFGNAIACIVYSSRYVDASMDGISLGTPTMFYSAVYVRGLAAFTAIAALSYLIWVWADARNISAKRKQRKLLTFNMKRLQNSRLHHYRAPEEGQDDRTYLKKSRSRRRIVLVFVSIFLLMWVVPSGIHFAQGWQWKYSTTDAQEKPKTFESACLYDRRSSECQQVVETGVSMTFQCLWLLLAALVIIISLMSQSVEPYPVDIERLGSGTEVWENGSSSSSSGSSPQRRGRSPVRNSSPFPGRTAGRAQRSRNRPDGKSRRSRIDRDRRSPSRSRLNNHGNTFVSRIPVSSNRVNNDGFGGPTNSVGGPAKANLPTGSLNKNKKDRKDKKVNFGTDAGGTGGVDTFASGGAGPGDGAQNNLGLPYPEEDFVFGPPPPQPNTDNPRP